MYTAHIFGYYPEKQSKTPWMATTINNIHSYRQKTKKDVCQLREVIRKSPVTKGKVDADLSVQI